MSVAIRTLPRPAGRPFHYAELLLMPINNDPASDHKFMPNWEATHAPHRRFYVAGTLWFVDNSGLNANRVAAHREEAVARFEQLAKAGEIDWRNIPGTMSHPGKYWRDLSRQQLNVAFRGEAVFLSKAICTLFACEIAVENALRKGDEMPNIFGERIDTPTDIYKGMAILPACWSVTGFDTPHLREAIETDPETVDKLMQACGQFGDSQFLFDMADGATVQFSTANSVAAYCREHQKLFGREILVRARSNKLGRAKGAALEQVDRG